MKGLVPWLRQPCWPPFEGSEDLNICESLRSVSEFSICALFWCIKDYELKEVYQLGIFHSMAKATGWQGLLWSTDLLQ